MQWNYPSFPPPPPPKKAKVVSSVGKVMASIFWDAKGILFIDYLQKGQTWMGNTMPTCWGSWERQSSQNSLENWWRESCFMRTMLLHSSLWLLCGTVAWTGWSPSIFSWFGIIWLLSVPQHEKHLAGKQYQINDEVISVTVVEDFFEAFSSCCGSVDKTTDSQSWGPGSYLLAAAVVPLGKALYPHCLVPRKGLEAAGPLFACL